MGVSYPIKICHSSKNSNTEHEGKGRHITAQGNPLSDPMQIENVYPFVYNILSLKLEVCCVTFCFDKLVNNLLHII